MTERHTLNRTIDLGNEGLERVTIPVGTEVVVEADYGETLDVSAWHGTTEQQDFWVRPNELDNTEE